ncbi:MAG: AtpZ/AtpI family protein [Acidobacteria bacterium]|nr:AtpZ/AtpI family protein [Acidobacteriota bacterium]
MIKNLLGDDNKEGAQPESGESSRKPSAVIGLFDSIDETQSSADEPFILSSTPRTSSAETARRFGLAWSIGLVFVVSVAFLMILGWGADLLFGSSPWGMVAGIVVGALIGFYQLFKISSQIFRD